MDPDYYRHSKRLDISEETKIRATKEEADAFFGTAMDTNAKPNFISDVFFLLNSMFHLGLVATIGRRIRTEREMVDLEKELNHLEGRSAEWAGVCQIGLGDMLTRRIQHRRRKAQRLYRS